MRLLRIHRPQILAAVLGVTFGLSSPSTAYGQAPNTPNLTYYVEGVGSVSLILNTEKIGVRFEEGVTPADRAAILNSQHVIDATTMTQVEHEPDTVLVNLRPRTSAGTVLDTLDRLSTIGEVYTAAPIVQAQEGYDAMVDTLFYVSLPQDASDADVETLNGQYGVETVDVLQLPERRKKTYTLRVTRAATLNALAMSQFYYGELGAMGAGPNFLCLYETQAGAATRLDPDNPYYKGHNHVNPNHYPTSPEFCYKQTHLEATHIPEAWAYTTGNPNVVIAVLDAGVDFHYENPRGTALYDGHCDLNPNQWINVAEWNGQAGIDDDANGYVDDFYGRDFVDGDNIAQDTMWAECRDDGNDPATSYWLQQVFPKGHGTNTAAVIGAVTNNGIGVAGIAGGSGLNGGAGTGCKIMPLRVWREPPAYPPGTETPLWTNPEYYRQAIVYAAKNGANVIALCGGFWEWNSGLQSAIEYAREQGCVLVAAVHNHDMPIITWPGRCKEVIATGGLNRCNESGQGPECRSEWVPYQPVAGSTPPTDNCAEGEPGSGCSDPAGADYYRQRKFGAFTGGRFDASTCSCNPLYGRGPFGQDPLTNKRLDESWGSNYGYPLDVMAPAVWVFTADLEYGPTGQAPADHCPCEPHCAPPSAPDDTLCGISHGYYTFNYEQFCKTSSAVPQVAAICGLLLSATLDASNKPTLTHAQVQAMLEFSADDLQYTRNYVQYATHYVETAGPGRDFYTGYGRVNAVEAIRLPTEHAWQPFLDDAGKHLLSWNDQGQMILEGQLYANLTDVDLDDPVFGCNAPCQAEPLVEGNRILIQAWEWTTPVTVALVNKMSRPNERIEPFEPHVIPRGSLLLKGRLYENIKVDLDSPEQIPGPAIRIQADTTTVAVFNGESFVNPAIEQGYGHAVPAGSLILSGIAFIGADADRVSSQGSGPGCEYEGFFTDRERGQGVRLMRELQEYDDSGYSDWDLDTIQGNGPDIVLSNWPYTDLDHDGLPDYYTFLLLENVLCNSSDPWNDEVTEALLQNEFYFKQDLEYVIKNFVLDPPLSLHSPVFLRDLTEMCAALMALSTEMQAIVDAFFLAWTNQHLPHYVLHEYALFPAVFNGGDDYDGDGLTNAAEYWTARASQGYYNTPTLIMEAIMDPDNGWQQRLDPLPLAGAFGLALLAAQVVVLAVLLARRKRGRKVLLVALTAGLLSHADSARATWHVTTATIPWQPRCNHGSVVYDNRIWIMCGDTRWFSGDRLGDIWSSTDGIHWVQPTTAAPLGYGGGRRALNYEGKMWELISRLWSSSDGVTWTIVLDNPPCPRGWPSAVVFDGKMWVTGGRWGLWDPFFNDVWSSPDGVTWTQVTAAAPWSPRYDHTSVVYDNKMWVIGGTDETMGGLADVWSSPDGVNWTCVTPAAAFGPRGGHTSVVFDGKIWVIAGSSYSNNYGKNDVWWSVDGANWTCATPGGGWWPRRDHTSVVFGNRMYIIGGDAYSRTLNDVLYSTDGAHWFTDAVSAPWGQAATMAATEFVGKLWVSGGRSASSGQARQAISYTSDGKQWTAPMHIVPWSGRWGHTETVYDDKLWLIGGAYDTGGGYVEVLRDVWWTQDGTSWTAATLNAPWLPRSHHGAVAYHGYLWIIGSSSENDVWRTTDGANWTQVSGALPWQSAWPRAFVFADKIWIVDDAYALWYTTDGVSWTRGATVSSQSMPVVYNGKLWVIAGLDPKSMWYSPDGSTWTQSDDPLPFPARTALPTVAAYDGKIWLMGGNVADIWYYYEQEPPFTFTQVPTGGWREEGAPYTATVAFINAQGNVTCQWLKDSYHIPDATDTTYEIASLGPGDTGWYTCLITDDNGTHATDPVYLQVFPPDSLPAAGPLALAFTLLALLAAFARARRCAPGHSASGK